MARTFAGPRRPMTTRFDIGQDMGMPKRPSASPRPRAGRRAGRRALIVETDPGTRRLCRDVLKDCGVTAEVVDLGVAAVAAARQQRLDLIIVDLQLSDSPGLEVVRWLRSNPALTATPVILLSAGADDFTDSSEWGADALLMKPVSAAALRQVVRSLLD
jgi:DNA-binding response OmpR family regulator